MSVLDINAMRKAVEHLQAIPEVHVSPNIYEKLKEQGLGHTVIVDPYLPANTAIVLDRKKLKEWEARLHDFDFSRTGV